MFGPYSSFGLVKTTLVPGVGWPAPPGTSQPDSPILKLGESTVRFRVLQHIRSHPGCSIYDIAADGRMKQPSVKRAVGFLLAHHAVYSKDHTGRKKLYANLP